MQNKIRTQRIITYSKEKNENGSHNIIKQEIKYPEVSLHKKYGFHKLISFNTGVDMVDVTSFEFTYGKNNFKYSLIQKSDKISILRETNLNMIWDKFGLESRDDDYVLDWIVKDEILTEEKAEKHIIKDINKFIKSMNKKLKKERK